MVAPEQTLGAYAGTINSRDRSDFGAACSAASAPAALSLRDALRREGRPLMMALRDQLKLCRQDLRVRCTRGCGGFLRSDEVGGPSGCLKVCGCVRVLPPSRFKPLKA